MQTFKQYFFDYFDLIGEFQPCPHCGKHFNMNASHLNILYPKFKDFLVVKNRLDPAGILTNTFLANLFKGINAHAYSYTVHLLCMCAVF